MAHMEMRPTVWRGMNGAYGNATYGVVWDAWRIWICGLQGCGMNGAFGNAPYGFKIKSASSNALDKKN
jgi:hypothetical protein